MRAALVLIGVAACSFEAGTFGGGSATDDAPMDTDTTDVSVIDAMPDTPPADARVCPAAPAGCVNFTCASSSSCYYVCGTATTGKQNYNGAVTSCTNVALGCIVTVNDQAENDCIAAATLPAFPSSLVWLGYEQASNGTEPAGGWAWECGASSYTAPNWGQFEPNDQDGEDCLLMTAGGSWLDGECTGTARFVCELP